MAEYTTHIDEESGITYIEVRGEIATANQTPYMNSAEFRKRTSLVVCDMREASLAAMTKGELAKMLREVKTLHKPGIRAAYVLTKGEDLSKAKLMVAQMEALGYEGDFKLFTNMDKAVAWIRKHV